MNVEVLQFQEAEPATYPTLTPWDEFEGAPGEALELDRAIWRRLESYICHRYTERQCVWTVQGSGDWFPHLSPVSNVTVDVWDDTLKTWSAATVDATPLGYYVPRSCVYRITATCGANAGDVPPMLVEAYQRLAAYAAEASASGVPAGASSHSVTMGDGWTESVEMNAAHMARAMANSGAGDLLRGYRRL